MPDRDRVQERVQAIVRGEARLALTGVGPTVSCHGCGDEVATDDAYSGRDRETGKRIYYCASCNAEHD